MGFSRLLNLKCTIQRKTVIYNTDTNQDVESWSNYALNVSCCKKTFTGDEFSGRNKIVEKATGKYYMNTGLPLTKNDFRIVEGGHTYDILHVSDASGRNHHLEIWVQEIS